MAMPLSYTYTLALLAAAVAAAVATTRVVQAEPEPGPSIEAINATCAPLAAHVQCSHLLLDNLDVRTPEVKDVIAMSVQVVAKKAAEAAAFAKATINKKPSKCVADCLGELAILSKHIQKLPATLQTAKDAGFFEQRFGKSKCTGNCCSSDSNSTQEECDAARKILQAIDALRVTDDLLSKRAFFRKQQQLPKENNST